MRRRYWAAGALFALLLATSRSAMLAPPVYAAPQIADADEETRRLLEKGLSVVEIDREIERIAGLREAVGKQTDETKRRLSEQEIAIAVEREKAGRVLRSYYMGQKDVLWAALLQSRSLNELLRAWETMDLILKSDRDAMDRYDTEYRSLQKGYATLTANQAELARVESDLKAQRERVVALQREIDDAVAASSDAERLRKLMDEMQAYWQNVGLYEVRQHFDALAKAMNKLPDWIGEHPDALKTNGLKATLTITDEQLNAFLRSQNEKLKQFAITFDDGVLKLDGESGDIRVGIEGHYTVEDKPRNAILFHIDKLVFNGLELPDTTRADLEREFDLGFYPDQVLKYVKADSVSLEPGKLIVRLRFGK